MLKVDAWMKAQEKWANQSCFFFYGEESYLLDRVISGMVQFFSPDLPDLNITTMQEGATVADIIASLEQLPCFAEQRIVFLDQLQFFSSGDAKPLIEYLPSMPETTKAIFIYRGLPDKRKALCKFLLKQAACLECNSPSEAELKEWIFQYAGEKKICLQKDALSFLLTMTNEEMYALKNELDKLAALGEETISLAIVQTICAKTLEYNVLLFHGFMLDHQYKKAMDLLKKITGDISSSGKENLFRFLRLIISNFRLMYMARACLDAKYSFGETANQVAKQAGVKPYAGQMAAKNAKHFTMDQLRDSMEKLEQLDFDLKRGRSVFFTERMFGIYHCIDFISDKTCLP